MYRKLLAALVVVATASGVLVAPVAAASCDPHRTANNTLTTYFAGAAYTNYEGITGISSYIYESDVWVDFTLPDMPTTAWVMLNEGGAAKWAQVGWIESIYGQRHMFDQTYLNGSYPYHEYAAKPEDRLTRYTVLLDKFIINGVWTWRFRYYADGNLVNSIPTDFDPSEGAAMTELKNRKNQVPGTISVPEQFVNTYKRQGFLYLNNDKWWDLNANYQGADDPTFQGFSRVSDSHYNVWDKGCS